MNTDKIGTIYLDQDGILAFCDKGIADFYNLPVSEYKSMPVPKKKSLWQALLGKVNIEDFFADLDWEPNAIKLLNWLKKNNLQYEILTRPVRQPGTNNCIQGKKIWLESHDLGHVPVIFEKNKSLYAINDNGLPNILIDDLDENINDFNASGGIGILYDSANYELALNQLEGILQ